MFLVLDLGLVMTNVLNYNLRIRRYDRISGDSAVAVKVRADMNGSGSACFFSPNLRFWGIV